MLQENIKTQKIVQLGCVDVHGSPFTQSPAMRGKPVNIIAVTNIEQRDDSS